MTRIISWFSCGVASAVATKLAIQSNKGKVTVVRCWLFEEHPDNDRFAKDCEDWFSEPITTLKNGKYNGSVDAVILKERFIVGRDGAQCTRKLKKDVRKSFQQPEDIQVFGYTMEEEPRYNRFIDANNEVKSWPILIEHGLSHMDCLAIIERAGIELPVMYKLGYKHNNCVGCVKGGAGYWNKIRVDFPERFKRMSELERNIGHSIIRLQRNGIRYPIFLDELPENVGNYQEEPEIQCGINCELTEKWLTSNKPLS